MHDRTAADLWELQRACSFLIERTAGHSAEEIQGDYELSLVVERLLERIGETLRRVDMRDPETAQRLPDYRRAINLRNIIAHQYYSLNWTRIKEVLDDSVPALLTVVDRLLLEIPEEIE